MQRAVGWMKVKFENVKLDKKEWPPVQQQRNRYTLIEKEPEILQNVIPPEIICILMLIRCNFISKYDLIVQHIKGQSCVYTVNCAITDTRNGLLLLVNNQNNMDSFTLFLKNKFE